MDIQLIRNHKIKGTEIETCIEEAKIGNETKYLISFLIDGKETKKLALKFNDLYELYNSFKVFAARHSDAISTLEKENKFDELSRLMFEKFNLWFADFDENKKIKRNDYFCKILTHGNFIDDPAGNWADGKHEFEFKSLDDFTLTNYAEEFWLTILFDIFAFWNEKTKKKVQQPAKTINL